MWDIDNPERITLPCANPNEHHDIRCIACVGDRIWVGAGPSIFFLNAENPAMREVGMNPLSEMHYKELQESRHS